VALELFLDDARMTNEGLRLKPRDLVEAGVAPASMAFMPSLDVLLLRREWLRKGRLRDGERGFGVA
jgi:hypothetical protein